MSSQTAAVEGSRVSTDAVVAEVSVPFRAFLGVDFVEQAVGGDGVGSRFHALRPNAQPSSDAQHFWQSFTRPPR